MNLKAVMDEVGAKLDTITGLRVFPYTADRVAPPAAIVGLPETLTFDETYGRGSDSITLAVHVLVGRADSRAAHAALSVYADGSGTKSVKAALDSSDTNTYAACDTATVSSVAFDTYTSAGVLLLGAEFTVTITGPGS